jgi:putative lipoprotein
MKPATALLAAALLCGVATEAHAEATLQDPWFAHDKYIHGSVSAALSLAGYGGAAMVTPDVGWRLGTGATLALTAGIGKELLDVRGTGDASWRDFTWNVFGTAAGLAIAYVLDTYVF